MNGGKNCGNKKGAAEKSGILDGRAAVCEFLHGASVQKIKKWVAAGMPVLMDGHSWLAHRDNIEEFFRAYTRPNPKNPRQREEIIKFIEAETEE